ncbi:MAG: hypothetical protein H7301_09455 [Cryobacterium sp.]|nr:hypothetical protein [Oligoflexia bacterium]
MKKVPMTQGMTVSRFSPSYQDLILVLKNTLRARGLVYRDLAKRMKMSESGVKKIFQANDGNISRLVEIGEAVGITLSELISEATHPAPLSIEFSSDADAFLAENFDYFEFFWKLLYERKTPNEIQQAWGISEKQVFKYLRKLDQLGMLELHEGSRVKLPPAEFGYFATGKLLTRMKNQWAVKAVEEAVGCREGEKKLFAFYYLQLSDESFGKLAQGIRDLMKPHTLETVRNVNSRHVSSRPFRMICAAVPGSFVK